jgi:hypothetical protein
LLAKPVSHRICYVAQASVVSHHTHIEQDVNCANHLSCLSWHPERHTVADQHFTMPNERYGQDAFDQAIFTGALGQF